MATVLTSKVRLKKKKIISLIPTKTSQMHELFVATYQKLENYTMYEFLPQGGNMDAGVA